MNDSLTAADIRLLHSISYEKPNNILDYRATLLLKNIILCTYNINKIAEI